MGPGTHLAKIGFKSAFRFLPVHVADLHLLGMQCRRGAVFVNIIFKASLGVTLLPWLK